MRYFLYSAKTWSEAKREDRIEAELERPHELCVRLWTQFYFSLSADGSVLLQARGKIWPPSGLQVLGPLAATSYSQGPPFIQSNARRD